MHTTTRLTDTISDVRSASNRHVYRSAVYRCILVGDVVIHRSPLLLIYARHVKILLSDRSRCFHILKNIQNRATLEQLFNLGFDVYGQYT